MELTKQKVSSYSLGDWECQNQLADTSCVSGECWLFSKKHLSGLPSSRRDILAQGLESSLLTYLFAWLVFVAHVVYA